MTSKERVHATLEGRPVDRCPITASYSQLYYPDHVEELTERPWWHVHRWMAMPPDEHAKLYREMHNKAPFELVQPFGGPRETADEVEYVERDGEPYRHDLKTGEWTKLTRNTSGFAYDYDANQKRHINTLDEIAEKIPIPDWRQEIAAGRNGYIDAMVKEFGKEDFILSSGLVGTVWYCGAYVGQQNLLAMLVEEPKFVEALSERITEMCIAKIRRVAAAGGDGIYIDDATATSDMISPAMYERFSLPYVKAMVNAIHECGHKAIVIYFGGVMDRLDLIAQTGADGFMYECDMKGYKNDTAEIARRVGDRMALFSNIHPFEALQNGTDEELEAEIRRQVEAGRRARGFIISTASPITPQTPLARVQKFFELARKIGKR